MWERKCKDAALREFDGLRKLREVVDWEAFRPLLREIFGQMTGGPIVDSTMVEVPRQRNTREEHAALRQGEDSRGMEGETSRKLAQKDVDAAWTKKHGVNCFWAISTA